MAFRSTIHTHNVIRHNNPLSRGAITSMSVISSKSSDDKNNARFMSTAEQDYSSMKVSELRELLKENGLPVSGIKAQLVQRLSSSNNAGVGVGSASASASASKPEVSVEKKVHKVTVVLETGPPDIGTSDDDDGEDLAGLLSVLKNIKQVENAVEPTNNDVAEEEDLTVKENTGKRIKNLTKMPGNLVFAKEGEEDDDDWDDAHDDDFDSDDDEDDDGISSNGSDPNQTVDIPRFEKKPAKSPRFEKPAKSQEGDTFREDFQGTRVFVQNLPKEATWQDLKDHFKISGEVVFASVSVDRRTGQSKQCGIVQYETPKEAQAAIRDMRNHPLGGEKLYVRKDVQESRQGGTSVREDRRRPRSDDDRFGDDNRSESRSAPPTEWKRANDEDEDGGGDNWYNLKDSELKEIESLVEKRDKQRMVKNYRMSDQLRDQLKDDFGVHLDDRLKLWWTDTRHGGVPGVVSEIKGEGGWGKQKPWRQIPTSPDSDAMVDSDVVMDLLLKRDRARKRKDFDTADDLLQKCYDAPEGELGLRIHDESRTWRIWTTERPPTKKDGTPAALTPEQMCLQIVTENEPEKIDEVKALLRKFPGREWNVFKKLKDRYG